MFVNIKKKKENIVQWKESHTPRRYLNVPKLINQSYHREMCWFNERILMPNT